MKVVSGVFNGSGAAVYICLGFVPDKVKIVALSEASGAEGAELLWSRNFRSAEGNEGRYAVDGNADNTMLGFGEGIAPYFGGDVMTAGIQTDVTYGEGVYIGWDRKDYRRSNAFGSDPGDGQGTTIDTWTPGTSATRAGNFNCDIVAAGNRIGEGSVITIDGEDYIIESLSAGSGGAADEVTLNKVVPAGSITYIGGRFDLTAIPIGRPAPAGILLSAVAGVNVNTEPNFISAISYDTDH